MVVAAVFGDELAALEDIVYAKMTPLDVQTLVRLSPSSFSIASFFFWYQLVLF